MLSPALNGRLPWKESDDNVFMDVIRLSLFSPATPSVSSNGDVDDRHAPRKISDAISNDCVFIWGN
jgi:hypothetical protein